MAGVTAEGRCAYLAAAGLEALDDANWRAVRAQARGLLLFSSAFAQPPPKAEKGSAEADTRFVKPREQRPVKAETKAAHPLEARELNSFLGDNATLRYALPADAKRAINEMLRQGENLPALRAQQTGRLRALAQACAPITVRMREMLREQRPESVRKVGDCMNVAFILALASALEWPHIWLGRALLLGFPITGDMETTGVNRPLREPRPKEEFAARAAEIQQGNKEWLYRVHERAYSRAKGALREAEGGAASSLETLRRVEKQTLKEIEKGHMGAPWSLQHLLAKFGEEDGSLRCRVLLRSGVLQGGMKEEEQVEPDGRRWTKSVQKLRVIDDAKRSLHNELQRHQETIHLCDFTYTGLVARELVQQCESTGWKFGALPPEGSSKRAQKRARRGQSAETGRAFDVPQLVFGCEDLTSAFRLCPVAEPEMNIVAVYCFDPPPGYAEPGVYYFPVYGHCFGFISSINNFSTVPALLCTIARCCLAVPLEAYVDDYNCGDLRLPNAGKTCGGQRAVVYLHGLFGWPIEMSKSQSGDTENKFLGMMTDTSKVTTLHRPPEAPLEVSFYPHEDRVKQILELMNSHDPSVGGSGSMTPHEADVLLGKLGFLLRGAHGSVGRGASQPIYARKNDKFGCSGWNEALAHAFAFFRKLFAQFPVRVWQLGVVSEPWLLVYTDACKNTRRGGLGVIIFDQVTGRKYVSSAICPKAVEDTFARGGKIINQLELLAILTALMTYPQLFRNRRAHWFVDNCSAISACVHGYAKKLDMAKMANSVQLALCALGSRVHFEWVPTGANIADTPSRVSCVADMTEAEGEAWEELKLPSEGEWDQMVFPSASDLASYDIFDQLLPQDHVLRYGGRAEGETDPSLP